MKLCDKVICKGYLKKQPIKSVFADYDTFKNSEYKYIEKYDPTLESIIIFDDVEETITQQKYVYTEKEFEGILVDIKEIVTSYYYTLEDDDYNGGFRVATQPNKEKVARVYYGLGKSRLVPIDKLEVI